MQKNNGSSKAKIKHAEFIDKELERECFNSEIENALKYIKPVLLFLGILYFLFIIPDYYLIKSPLTFKIILINRAIIVLAIGVLYYVLNACKEYKLFAYCLTICEVMASISFLYIFYQYESPDYLIQAYGVMLIVLSIFLIPNKWKLMLISSSFVVAGFAALTLYYVKDVEASKYWAGLVYTILAALLSAIGSHRLNYFMRSTYYKNRELLRLSYIDMLTSIYNRKKFDEELNSCIESKSKLCLIMFDIDDFKAVNDIHGHQAGDKVMVDMAMLVSAHISKTDVFARWGGEEFAILLPDTDKSIGIQQAEKLRVQISEHSFSKVGRITCSFGVVELDEDDNFEAILHRGDKLLYQAKSSGKNIVIY